MAQERFHGWRSDAAAGVNGLLPQVVFAAAVGTEILLRNVDATLLEIAPHVAQDVGQLQGDAEVDRVLLRRRLAAAEDVEADEPDGRRHANAVLVEVVERLVAARPEIHLDAFDERLERRPRQAEGGDERGERASLPRLGRAAFEAGGQLRAPAGDLGGGRRSSAGLALAGHVDVVDGIIDGAAEVPDGDDRVPLGRRQHQERIVEAGVAGQGSIVGQRQSTASRMRPGMSRFPIVGR